MTALFGNLFRKQFVVDENPERVERLQSQKLTTENWRGETPATTEKPEKPPDLLSEISQLVREHDRLESLTEDLRTSKSDPGKAEFQRFFRASLTLLDGFDRVREAADTLPHSEELGNWLKSVASIHSRMVKLFERFGLRVMDPAGKPVDLDRHEVIEVLHTDSLPDEQVVEVRQKGYTFDGKILRDARVVVAKNERK